VSSKFFTTPVTPPTEVLVKSLTQFNDAVWVAGLPVSVLMSLNDIAFP
jgi:hypothetical protein